MFIISSMGGGGAERVMATLASELSKSNKVYIVAYYDSGVRYYVDDNVEVKYLNVGNAKNRFSKLRNFLKRIHILRKLKKKYKIDVAISMLPSPNFENVLSKSKEKVIISIRNKYSSYFSKIENFINKVACKYSDYIVTLSKNIANEQVNLYHAHQGKVLTIYNPCDYNFIEKLSSMKLKDDEFYKIRDASDFLIITAGRLENQKGQWHLIRAFSKVVARHPKAKLIILGRGALEEYLKQLIVKLKLENNIFLLGFYNNPYPCLAKSDLFVFTSLYEGFGNILLEAMACNLPILSCDCDAGPRELLAPSTNPLCFTKKVEFAEYGIITPVMNGEKYEANDKLTMEEEIFADTIINLIEQPDILKKYREKSKERIKEFSLEKIIKQWEEIL